MRGRVSCRGPISRLIYGTESSRLSVLDGCLLLDGGSNERSIPVSEISDLAVCEVGPVWATARVYTTTGEHLLRGFPKASLPAVVIGLNRDLREDVERRFAHLDEPLAECVRGIEALTSHSVYVRASRWRRFRDSALDLIAVRENALWRKFATAEQRAAVGAITLLVENAEQRMAEANGLFVQEQLQRHSSFFDTIESQPLTDAQRRACVINEDHNLVLAGAGTGKTSTMIGRTGYLIASGEVRPDEVLMLAFARKAAEEMQERQDSRLAPWLTDSTPIIKTFHALGLEIIGKAEGRRPDITTLAEDPQRMAGFIDETIASQCEEPEYRRKMVKYCGTERFPYRNPFDFETMEQYLEYVRVNELRTLKGEVVKSFEEVFVANYLNANGIAYEYERAYKTDTSGPDHRQYRPDFYLPRYDVYIEHFALNQQGRPPLYFREVEYLEGVRWKRELHAREGTRLIETHSYMKREEILEGKLVEQLAACGVEFAPRSDKEMLAELRASSEVTEFALLVRDFLLLLKQAGERVPGLRQRFRGHPDGSRIMLMLDLLEPVLGTYEAYLAETGSIDFADMISRATDHVRVGRYLSPYKHILVDEFQDISRPRAQLIQALLAQRDDAVLFAVGDDWQSIYRFTGSDIGYTRDFERLFGSTAVTSLDTTFRFNDKIGDVASKFILRNPQQLRKVITSVAKTKAPAVSLVRSMDPVDGLRAVLDGVARHAAYGRRGKASVLVLGRFNHTVERWRSTQEAKQIRTVHPRLDVKFMTVHAAKGKEADYVVVLDVNEGRYGFPSERPADPLLEVLLPPLEAFPFAEERRLFYVALTRARRRAYVLYDPEAPSVFVRELLGHDDPYSVAADEFDAAPQVAEEPHLPCPTCRSGLLTVREGPHGRFMGCTHYPYCRHHESLCPQCGAPMRRLSHSRVCVNAECGAEIPLCAACGADMVLRTGKYGHFWGCTSYVADGEFGCTYTRKVES